jgi:hypothetical protein
MDQTRIITHAGRRWLVRPSADPLLADGWPVDRPDRLAPAKRGRGRTVSRLDAAGRAYFVKTRTAGGLWRRLRARLGLGPGRREWDALLLARRADVPVPEPVALALDGSETLVTEAVPDAVRLDAYLFDRYFPPPATDPPYPGARPPELVAACRRRVDPPAGTLSPRELAYLLADLVARLAETDLFLPDLHPGNLLVSGEPGRWRLTAVDLAEAVHPAPPEAVLKHLVRLEHFFEPLAHAAERLRCLVRLRALLADAVPDGRTVARATAVYRRRFYVGRDRRTRRRSKYFRPVSAGPWRGWATTDWADVVQTLLSDREEAQRDRGTEGQGDEGTEGRRRGEAPSALDSVVPSSPGRVEALKDGRSSAVWTVTAPGGRDLVVKLDRRAGERTGRLLGPTRALAGFRRGHALLARGIPTARPAAAVRRTGAPDEAAALLLTERVAGAVPLPEWLRAGPAPAARRHVTWALAAMLRRLHEAGFTHRDLKAPNVLVADDGPVARPVLVDLDGLRRSARVSARRRVRDLMRLAVSLEEWRLARATDRWRFLRAYLGRRGVPRPIAVLARRRGRPEPARRLRRWWRAVERVAQRKRRALRRRYGRVERL